ELVEEQLGGRPGRVHRDVLQRVGDEEAEVFPDLVPAGESASDGEAAEHGEEQLAPVEIDGGGPGGIEEVRVEVAELEQLADAGDLQAQARRVPVAEEVVLRELGLAEEALPAREPETDLEGAGELLLDRHLDDHLVVGRAPAGIDLDRVEETERGDALLGEPDPGAAVEVALTDAHLA